MQKRKLKIKICTKRLHTIMGTIQPGQAVWQQSFFNSGVFSVNIKPYLKPNKTYAHLLKDTRDRHFRDIGDKEWVCSKCGMVKNLNSDKINSAVNAEICDDCERK
jgi:hypothetical protein